MDKITKKSSGIEIVSWNVNSVNARIENITRFIKQEDPYALLLQELKCVEDKFPTEVFEDLGYNAKVSCQKGGNGVAVISKGILDDVKVDFFKNHEARYIEASTYIDCQSSHENDNNRKQKRCIRLVSIYVPHGGDIGAEKFAYKLKFLEQLNAKLKELSSSEELLIVGGDFNVAPDIGDVYNPKRLSAGLGFHIEERDRFRRAINENSLVDCWRLLNPGVNDMYTWWDYRTNGIATNRGMRIDNLLLSPDTVDIVSDAKIYKNVRTWERPSDHVPLSITLGC